MIDVFSIHNAGDAVTFAAWLLVVLGMVRFAFYSFPMAEYQYRRAKRFDPARRMIKTLEWEIHHRKRYDPAIVEKSPKGEGCAALTAQEVVDRQRAKMELEHGSFGHRFATYLFDCVACQAFWCSLLTLLATRGWIGVVPMIATAIAYAFAAQVAHAWLVRSAPAGARQSNTGCSGGKPGCAGGTCGCGK